MLYGFVLYWLLLVIMGLWYVGVVRLFVSVDECCFINIIDLLVGSVVCFIKNFEEYLGF